MSFEWCLFQSVSCVTQSWEDKPLCLEVPILILIGIVLYFVLKKIVKNRLLKDIRSLEEKKE